MKSENPDSHLLTSKAEAARILSMCGNNLQEAMAVVERQFNTLHNRAQVLFSFCGIVITVTGFSGRLIAGTSDVAQALIVGGLMVVVGCAFYMFHSVMTLRWATQRLAHSKGRAQVLIPNRGFTQLNIQGGPMYDPEADRGFLAGLRETLEGLNAAHIKIEEFDLHINDNAFAETLAERMDTLVRDSKQ